MPPVLFEVKDQVAIITLNRVEKYNAINREMALLLQDNLYQCGSDNAVRCIYITGSGKAFSSGQDLAEVTDNNGLDITTILSEHYNPIIKLIRNIGKPVVAAVNGVAAGAGANIALACDVILASKSASFIQAFSKIGLIPDSGGTFFLPRLIGWQKALGLAMLGDRITSSEAENLGMVYKIFPDETFVEESMNVAILLSALPTKTIGFIKEAFNQSLGNSLEEQLKTEVRLQVQAAQTNDFKEGVEAFMEKRRPIFKGL